MVLDVVEPAALQHHHAHHLDEVRHRIQPSNHDGPIGHAINRGEQAAHQHEDHHEEKGDGHGLLLGFGIGGDQ